MTEFCDCIFRFLKSSQNGAACTLMQVRQERRVFCRIHLCDQTEVDDEDAAHDPSDGGEMKWQMTVLQRPVLSEINSFFHSSSVSVVVWSGSRWSQSLSWG